MISGKFTPLTIINNEDPYMDSMITTFNTAATETASEILDKQISEEEEKKPWVMAEIRDLYSKRREPR